MSLISKGLTNIGKGDLLSTMLIIETVSKFKVDDPSLYNKILQANSMNDQTILILLENIQNDLPQSKFNESKNMLRMQKCLAALKEYKTQYQQSIFQIGNININTKTPESYKSSDFYTPKGSKCSYRKKGTTINNPLTPKDAEENKKTPHHNKRILLKEVILNYNK